MTQINDNKKPMVQNISCILPENQELGGLFLGNVFGAQNAAILKQYGIRAVITASIQTNISYPIEDIPFHLKLQAHDKEDYYIIEHVNDCIHFIQQKRKLTNVYVHCYAGVSRSSAIVASYLMYKYRWPLQKTLAFLVHKRIVAKPNDGFMKQLKEVQQKLNINPQQPPSRSSSQTNLHQQNIVTQQEKMSIKSKYPHQQQVAMTQRSQSYSGRTSAMNTKPLSPPLNLQNTNNIHHIQAQQHYMTHQQADRQTLTMMTNRQLHNPNHRPLIQHPKQQEKISIKPYPNHNNIPIPKVLQKKMSQTQKLIKHQNDYEIKTINSSKNVPYNYPPPPSSSKTLIPTSPRDKTANRMSNTEYYNNALSEQSKGYFNNLNNNSFNNSKKLTDSQEKTKVSSRVAIRPKDLPGYKHY